MSINNLFRKIFLVTFTSSVLIFGSTTNADDDSNKGYTLTGACAFLPASRATEFHGNAARAKLLLGMAGNQWVVFDKVIQGFNASRGLDATEPAHKANPFWTLAELRKKSRDYYIQLIPPGLIRKQIKSGCLVLGNDETRNFLPGSIQVNLDIFASTNYTLMQDLAKNGFVKEAVPYIKNKLDLMVAKGNPLNIGTAGAPGTYPNIYDITMKLLDPTIIVSEVDHINEGIHRAINNMYKAMDEYIRENGSATDIAKLDAALLLVAKPQAGSPAATRTGISTNFDLATNPECHYKGHPTIADGTLRFCEFAVLNKANTHETKVHHVETPGGILNKPGFVKADIGPVWTSELKFAQAEGDQVDGMDQVGGSGGVSSPTNANPVVNKPATYSIALLATAQNKDLAKKFIEYIRSPDGQSKYTNGGFIGLTQAEMDKGECYKRDKAGVLTVTPRTAAGC